MVRAEALQPYAFDELVAALYSPQLERKDIASFTTHGNESPEINGITTRP